MQDSRKLYPRILAGAAVLSLILALPLSGGCADLFSPSFVETFFPGPEGSSAFLAVEAPTGHVPILFDNQARIADEVFQFLIQGDTIVRQEVVDELLRVNPGLQNEDIAAILEDILVGNPTNLEDIEIPPRVRMIVDVTNTSGGVQRLEFLDGLRLVRGEDQVAGTQNTAELPPDLEENTNNIFIVQCDVARIEIVSIQVFIPVVLRLLETVIDPDGDRLRDICSGFRAPQFDDLEEDLGFDPFFEVFNTLQNYDPRNFPPPLDNLECGAVVVIALEGDLTLPFREVPGDCLPTINPPANGRTPGFFIDNFFDLQESLRIPGRYEVSIRIRDQ